MSLQGNYWAPGKKYISVTYSVEVLLEFGFVEIWFCGNYQRGEEEVMNDKRRQKSKEQGGSNKKDLRRKKQDTRATKKENKHKIQEEEQENKILQISKAVGLLGIDKRKQT